MPIQLKTPEGDAYRQSKTDTADSTILTITAAQAITYLNANVTDLPTAKTYLKNLTKLVILMRDEGAKLKAEVAKLRAEVAKKT